MTLKSLLRLLQLRDDDPVGRELSAARARAFEAVDTELAASSSPLAATIRKQFKIQLTVGGPDLEKSEAARAEYNKLYSSALRTARQTAIAMREGNEIGDDAFHQLEEQLDWLEMAGGLAVNGKV